MLQSDRKSLLQWCFWFFAGNILLFYMVGWNFLRVLPWLDVELLSVRGKYVLEWFAAFTYLGQLGLLALLPYLFLIPVILIFPRKRLIVPISIIIMTLMAILLTIDGFVYKIYRFHLGGIIFDLILNAPSGDLFGISRFEGFIAIALFCVLGLLEISYGYLVYRFFINKFFLRQIKWVVIFVALNLYLSYAIIFFSAQYFSNRIFLDAAQALPLFREMFGIVLKSKNLKYETFSNVFVVQPKKLNEKLQYPIAPLQFETQQQPLLNVVVIGIDAWRFDMLNDFNMPHLASFSRTAWVFNNHFSGGDATGPGIFSLFYGLPASYWTAMEAQQRAPLLMDEFAKHHYQSGIFSSSEIYLPAFNKTVFQHIHPLELEQPDGSAYDHDKMVTQKMVRFIKLHADDKQPFFGYVFYDAVHSYCTFEEDLKPLQPTENCNRWKLTSNPDPLPFFNRYQNAVSLVDGQISEVLATLKLHHLLDKTIVIVTGDHGEEFNDNHQGFWGHASNFTRYQVQTPLVIYWPGQKPQVFTHQTSHFDIAPTLMKRLFGCVSPASSYSLGVDLLQGGSRPYLIVNSYISLGILEPDQITDISPTGQFQIQRPDGKIMAKWPVHAATIQQVFHDLHRFYHNSSV